MQKKDGSCCFGCLLFFIVLHHINKVSEVSNRQQHLNIETVVWVLICDGFERTEESLDGKIAGADDTFDVLLKLLAKFIVHSRIPKILRADNYSNLFSIPVASQSYANNASCSAAKVLKIASPEAGPSSK